MTTNYKLENLYNDQDPDLVIDSIAPVLAWVPGTSKRRWVQPYKFQIHHELVPGNHPTIVELELEWNIGELEERDPGVEKRADRMRRKKSAHQEDVAKLAAYGLSFVAISIIYPGLRIIGFNHYAAPDLLYDITPGAIKGFEVAGRSIGGHYVLTNVRHGNGSIKGKQQQLLARTDIAEAHLALWCASPRIALMAKVK